MPRSTGGEQQDGTSSNLEQMELMQQQLAQLLTAQQQAAEQQEALLERLAQSEAATTARFNSWPNPQLGMPPAAEEADLGGGGGADDGGADDQGGHAGNLLGGQDAANAPAATTRPPASLSARLRADGAAPAPADDLATAEDDREEAEELLQHLGKLGGRGDSTAAQLLAGGHPTPVPHDETNPFMRAGRYCDATGHLNPRQTGDFATAETVEELKEIIGDGKGEGKWAQPYMYELWSLAPALSYLHDMREAQVSIASELGSALSSGALPQSLAHLPSQATAVATQLDSTYQHLNERLGVIHSLTRSSDPKTEALAQVYRQGQRRAGTMSLLEQAIDESISDKRIAALTAIEAREQARARPFTTALRPQLQPQRQRDFRPRPSEYRGGRPGSSRRPAPSSPSPAQQPPGGGGRAPAPAPARAPAAGAPAAAPGRGAARGVAVGQPGRGRGRG
jgi:hypothetical protein